MAAPRPVCPPSPADLPPLRVDRIGAEGDGVATLPDGTVVFLPGTLPGETVQPGPLSRRGRSLAAASTILDPSPERIEPACPHFGACGGCTLQHWADTAYAAWKLARVGFPIRPPATLARTPPGARRRMDLAIRRDRGSVLIGLHRRRSTEVVDMHACPVLHPKLFALVQALRPVMAKLDGFRRQGEAHVNLLDSGPDLTLRTDGTLSATDRMRLAQLAEAHGMPRISWVDRRGLSRPRSSDGRRLRSRVGTRKSRPSASFRHRGRVSARSSQPFWTRCPRHSKGASLNCSPGQER